MSGYFTKSEEVQVDIDMDDIIDNLNAFSKQDLQSLLEEVIDLLDVEIKEGSSDTSFSIIPNNLYDEQKMEYIKKIYSKMNIDQLKELTNKLV